MPIVAYLLKNSVTTGRRQFEGKGYAPFIETSIFPKQKIASLYEKFLPTKNLKFANNLYRYGSKTDKDKKHWLQTLSGRQ